VFLLNGQYTKRIGVIDIKDANAKYSYTDLERTLIDISIRPVYSGGVFEVLGAYESAKNMLDVKKLKKYLEKINYTYPYHQVIGFYLDKAGYPPNDLELFKNNIDYKFYLTYNIKKPNYDDNWKMYYPKGFS
jgi:predicted transcriptional regulator of viral defense system